MTRKQFMNSYKSRISLIEMNARRSTMSSEHNNKKWRMFLACVLTVTHQPTNINNTNVSINHKEKADKKKLNLNCWQQQQNWKVIIEIVDSCKTCVRNFAIFFARSKQHQFIGLLIWSFFDIFFFLLGLKNLGREKRLHGNRIRLGVRDIWASRILSIATLRCLFKYLRTKSIIQHWYIHYWYISHCFRVDW